jgi:hypothetical protein
MVPCISDNNSKQNPTRCTTVLKSFKTFNVSYFALHVSGTLVPIIRSLLFYCTHSIRYRVPLRWLRVLAVFFNYFFYFLKIFKTFIVSYFALHVSVTLVPIISSERTQLEHATNAAAHGTGGCECSKSRRLLMMGTRVPETCRAI